MPGVIDALGRFGIIILVGAVLLSRVTEDPSCVCIVVPGLVVSETEKAVLWQTAHVGLFVKVGSGVMLDVRSSSVLVVSGMLEPTDHVSTLVPQFCVTEI